MRAREEMHKGGRMGERKGGMEGQGGMEGREGQEEIVAYEHTTHSSILKASHYKFEVDSFHMWLTRIIWGYLSYL